MHLWECLSLHEWECERVCVVCTSVSVSMCVSVFVCVWACVCGGRSPIRSTHRQKEKQKPQWRLHPSDPRHWILPGAASVQTVTLVPPRVNILYRTHCLSLLVSEEKSFEIISFSEPNACLCFKGTPQANPDGAKQNISESWMWSVTVGLSSGFLGKRESAQNQLLRPCFIFISVTLFATFFFVSSPFSYLPFTSIYFWNTGF